MAHRKVASKGLSVSFEYYILIFSVSFLLFFVVLDFSKIYLQECMCLFKIVIQ